MSETSTAPETAPIDPAVEAALEASREARIESLLELGADPERLGPPRARRRHGRGRGVDRRDACAAWARPRSRSSRPTLPPDRLRRLAPRRRTRRPSSSTATTTSSRSTRSTCGSTRRSSRSCATAGSSAAASADDKGQLRMHLSAAEALRDARARAAVNLRFVFEGEEEFGSASLRGVDRRAPRPARGRRRRHQRHRLLRGQPAGDHRRPARASCTRRSTSSCRRSTSTRAASAATVQNPANALATIIAALKGPDGRVRVPGLLRRRRAADRRRSAQAIAGLPFDEEAYRDAIPVPGARRRGGLHDARAAGRPPDARRQRHVERVPGRGRQDDHPGPRPREDLCRLVADQDPSGSSRRCATTSRRSRRPASRVDDQYLHGGRPSLTPSTTRRRGRRPGARRRVRRRPRVSSARAARSRSPRCSSTTSACRSSCSGSRSRPATPTRPTSGSSSRTSSAARGSSCGMWDELAAASGVRSDRAGRPRPTPRTFGPSTGIGSGGCAPRTRC